MHATLEGVVKQLLNLWLDSKNHNRTFYLNNSICLDKVLLKTKYPSEFPRSQRSISAYYLYKANELRNLLFYSLIYIVKEKLKKEYYEHLVLFILFIRVLTKNKIWICFTATLEIFKTNGNLWFLDLSLKMSFLSCYIFGVPNSMNA
jgi:hypothetical protein